MLMLMAAAFLAGCRNSQESYAYGGKIKGRVVLVGVTDGDYSGVKVAIKSTAVNTVLTTLLDGKFSFTDIPDGTYSITCTKTLCATANMTGIVIEKSSEKDIGNLLLNPSLPPGIPDINN